MSTATQEQETEEQDTSRQMDAELKTMGRINRLMQDLDLDAQRRVASWIHDRFEISPANRFFSDLKTQTVNKLRAMEPR